MPSTFIYSNRARNPEAMEAELHIADRAGYTVDLHRAFWEHEPPSVLVADRPRLQAMMRQVRRGDVVVVMALRCLGSTVAETLETIGKVRRLGAALHCLQLGPDDLASATPPEAVKVLRAAASLDGATRSARIRESLAAAKAVGHPVGRPPKHTPEQRDAILRALNAGESVSAAARRFDTTRQTVMRIRASAGAIPPAAEAAKA